MKKNKIMRIGGEFEINPDLLNDFDMSSQLDMSLFSTGRAALMAILSDVNRLKKNKIHVPYYICHTVIEACLKSGFEVEFYELTNKFLFPIEYLENIQRDELLLSVNYFGFVNDNNLIINIRAERPDILIVSDHVQSIWTVGDSKADYAFTSYRKHLPVTDGALVYKNGVKFELQADLEINTFAQYKLIGALLKHYNITDRTYLSYFEKGEIMLYLEEKYTKCSEASSFILSNLNLNHIESTRKKNYKLVYEYCNQKEIDLLFDYDSNITPLCIPIKLTERDKIRKSLMNHNIFLPVHWPLSKYSKMSSFAANMAENELSIVIDQRYSEKEITYQMDQLIKYI